MQRLASPMLFMSAVGDQTRAGSIGAGLTSAQTTSLFPAAGGAMIPMTYRAHVPSKVGQGLG